MKISCCGYFTESKTLENSALRFLKEVAPKILKSHSSKVKKLEIKFFKNSIPWGSYGFKRLWNAKTKTATIAISYLFRSLHRSKWLIIHELFHLRQLIEKRFNSKSLHISTARFQFPNGKKIYKFEYCKKYYICLNTNRIFKYAPWEEEVWMSSNKFCRSNNLFAKAYY